MEQFNVKCLQRTTRLTVIPGARALNKISSALRYAYISDVDHYITSLRVSLEGAPISTAKPFPPVRGICMAPRSVGPFNRRCIQQNDGLTVV